MKTLQIFLIITVTAAVAGKELLSVSIGEDVTLQCHYEVNTKISLVEWTKPDLKSPEYVFLYRDERPFTSYQHPSFAGRVELKDKEMKDGDVSIILRNISTNDAGVYECRVVQDSRTRVKRTNIHTDPIRVIHLEVKPSVAEILPVSIGEDVTLQCHYEVDTKISLVEWTRPDLESPEYVFLYDDEHSFKSYQHPSFAGRVQLKDKEMKDGDVSLLLSNVSSSDAGVYECRVVQDSGTRVKRTNIHTEPIRVIHLVVEPSGDINRTLMHIGAAASLTLLMVAVILVIVKYRKSPKSESTSKA